MFDIGWSELLLVAVLAIVFVGPKDLPRLMRTLGQYTAKMRAMAREFQQSFEDMAKESELDDLRKEVEAMRAQVMKPLSDLGSPLDAPKPQPAPVPDRSAEPLLPAEDLPEAMVDAIREAEAVDAHPDIEPPIEYPAGKS